MPYACYGSPVGRLALYENNGALTELRLLRAGDAPAAPNDDTPLLRRAQRQLAEYFAHRRTQFTLPLAPAGTPFQQAVWAQLRAIPCGETRTYGQIAAALGRPKAARAVGMACRSNPLLLVVPCHRVIGADGSLTGFAGGLAAKQALLALEQGTPAAPAR